MGESKHTPWELGRVEDGHGMALQDSAVVFMADGGMIEVSETPAADTAARLIAAAPDLLAACGTAFDFFGGVDDASEIRSLLMSVIAKAEGRS